MSEFPKNFFWGAATSSHQVEGNNHNDWSEWEKLGRVKHGEQSGLASGYFQRWREDLALAKSLGHNAYRFSIEWSRVMPRPGVIDQHALDFYRDVVQECRRLGLEPFVTLWHFTNPIWIAERGAWLKRETVDFFGQYVSALIQTMGTDVTYWVTINEPNVYCSLGYMSAFWPPQRRSPIAAWLAIRNLLAAHKLAAGMIHRANPTAKVGSANNMSDFQPARPKHPLDRLLVPIARYWHNQWWIDATHDTIDFIGLNYYFIHRLKFKFSDWRNWFAPEHPTDRIMTDMGWPVAPDGLGRQLRWLKKYDRPIIITENGLADADDTRRARFIIDHLREVEHALQDGVDIQGYLHWSLLDNFEWRDGFDPRFGLIAVDYHTMKRTPRASASVYQKIIAHNGLDGVVSR